jgi:pimeloyl-ACP methyl ester carboxylesterase
MRTAILAAYPHAPAALTAALEVRDGVLDALAHVPVPVLLRAGERDPGLPAIQDTADQTLRATFVEPPGCGHFDTFPRIDLTLPIVLPFLDRCVDG